MIWVFKALLDYPHLLLLPSPIHLKLPNTAQFWRTERLWHKITRKLHLEPACSCLYLFRAGKSFWSAFSYLSNDLEIFQALRFQQPLFFQCSGMAVLMCLNLSSSPSTPEVGTKVFQWFFLLISAVILCDKMCSKMWKKAKILMFSCRFVCFLYQ